MYLEEKIKEINNILSVIGKEVVAVWGVGKHTDQLVKYTDILKYNICFFVDRNADEHPVSKAYGRPLYLPDMVDLSNADCIVISSYRFQNEIKEEIINRGYKGKIILLYTDKDEGDFYYLPDLKNESFYFTGDYKTWEEAEAKSNGYTEQSILNKVLDSTKLVMSGKACFERDSVAFYYREYNYRLISIFGLLARKKPKIGVLDYGGALGSEYWKNREILHRFGVNFSWNIIEQEHYVEIGETQVANDELHFYKNIDKLNIEINLVLFSGVLQYIDKYKIITEQVLRLKPEHILVDLQAVGNRDRICVQHVGKKIYQASYPIRIINERSLLDCFNKEYELQVDLEVEKNNPFLYVDGRKFQYKCYWFKRKEENKLCV